MAIPLSVAAELVPAIVAAAQSALPEVLVTNTFALTADPGDSLMVAYRDDGQPAITFTRDLATAGADGSIDESGDITCTVASWTGDPDDPQGPVDQVLAIGAAVAELCRIRPGVDPGFGVPGVLWTVAGGSGSVDPFASSSGRAALLQFSIHYEARLLPS